MTTPANDNHTAQVTRLQADFALRAAASPREQVLALTRGPTGLRPSRPAAPAVARVSAPSHPLSPLLCARACA